MSDEGDFMAPGSVTSFFDLAPAKPVDPVPDPDLSWFYIAIDSHRTGYIIDAAEAFFTLDIFPSRDADECGVFIPAEFEASPGLYKVSPVRLAGWDDDDGGGLEVSGDWTPCFVVPGHA